ncbi:Dak1 domain-containing protein [Lipomyces japonicus]|uniref:Dak1 domain-containing protein n=1 Tax=Lipomyces japonicus TaxID=56871 RepID=UPI0034CF6C8B
MAATKHFYPLPQGLVDTALNGLIASHSDLALLSADKIVYHATHDRAHVSVLSGGGSGHEPAHSGYVGQAMLAAAVCGDVFASPSAKQVITACRAVPSDEGFIFVVTNYTGDMLHFGLACEKLRAEGYKVGIVQGADDVAVGRKNGGMVGRRGLAGTIIINKLVGAYAATGAKFDDVFSFGKHVGLNLVTISAGLDHCHVPGRPAAYGALDASTCEIGMGIHNEPGVRSVSPIPPIDDLTSELLKYLLDQTDLDRAFVPFNADADEIVLLVNNLGGISTLELRAITQVAITILKRDWNITPTRVLAGTFITSLNAPAFSLTLFNASNTAAQAGLPVAQVLELFDAPTDALCWPRTHKVQSHTAATGNTNGVEDGGHQKNKFASDILVNPAELRSRIEQAAYNVIAAEPKLTEWDTEMGDGDCGTTVESGANGVLEALQNGVADSGSVLKVVDAIVNITEDKMGGTLGAVFGIFFAAFFTALVEEASSSKNSTAEAVLSSAAVTALASLRTHTPAKEGDRTVMDVLIPFVSALEKGGISAGLAAAELAAQGTRRLVPKLGRATYVGGNASRHEFPPDPGAWALYEIVRGLAGSN